MKNINMRFEAKKGARLHRYFRGVTLLGSTDLWFNTTLKVWETLSSHQDHEYSTHAPCRTLKAYKRMLRKFPQIIGKSCLVNKYIGYDVYA